MKLLVVMTKALLTALFHPPKQEFVNELYQREQAKYYKRHAGIGRGPADVPDGKYINRNTRYTR
jgi:hypothetical protein